MGMVRSEGDSGVLLRAFEDETSVFYRVLFCNAPYSMHTETLFPLLFSDLFTSTFTRLHTSVDHHCRCIECMGAGKWVPHCAQVSRHDSNS